MSSLSKDNCLDYLDRACLFRAKFLIRHCLSLVLENQQMITDADADWTRLVNKHPELAVELFKCKVAE